MEHWINRGSKTGPRAKQAAGQVMRHLLMRAILYRVLRRGLIQPTMVHIEGALVCVGAGLGRSRRELIPFLDEYGDHRCGVALVRSALLASFACFTACCDRRLLSSELS